MTRNHWAYEADLLIRWHQARVHECACTRALSHTWYASAHTNDGPIYATPTVSIVEIVDGGVMLSSIQGGFIKILNTYTVVCIMCF